MKKIIFCLLIFIASNVNAQHWKGVGGGMDDGILCFYNDTIRHLLYAGGSFHYAGGVLVEKIAKWDGVIWSEMSGVNYDVLSITADSDFVYVANGHYALKYTGTNWLTLPAFSANVMVVGVVNGELYAGGDFLYQGTNFVNHIAKWNGTSWDSLGPGLGEPPLFGRVDAITEYQGKLVAGGLFKLAGTDTMSSLAIWDGTSWHSIGGGLHSNNANDYASVYDLFVDGDSLYVAGDFEYTDSIGGLTVNGIAMWDGTNWHNFGNGAFVNGLTGSVLQVIKTGSDLFAVGDFDNNFRLVKWDGSNWNSFYDGELNGLGECIAFYNNEFYVGSVSLTDTNGQVLNYIARSATFDLANDTVACSNSCNGAATAAVLGVLPNTYLWSNGNTTQSINNLCVGTYTVTVTDSTGSSSFGTVTVTSLSTIVITDTSTNASCPTCTDGSATINNTSGGTPPYSYLWSNGATTNSIDSLLQGTYTVTVTDNNGCAMVDSVTVGFDVGTKQLAVNNNQLTVYPNPVTDEVTVSSNHSAINTISIFDVVGKEIFYSNNNHKSEIINLKSFSAGVYFIKFTMKDGSVTVKRIVKQ